MPRITGFHLLLYAIVTGGVATAAGLLAATFWRLPFTPYTVWIWTTGVLVMAGGLLAPVAIGPRCRPSTGCQCFGVSAARRIDSGSDAAARRTA